MSETLRALVLGSFAGDALALGSHWIYDPHRIARDFGRTDTLTAPPPDSYHAGKQAGDFTHYGDQTLVLLESLAACRGFDLQDFARRWRALFQDYRGYRDGASRKTLERFEFGTGPENSGSTSVDLAGASRLAPLVYALHRQPEALVAAARAQTKMTHAATNVVDAAEFFARATLLALEGAAPRSALERAATATFATPDIPAWVRKGLASVEQDTVTALNALGPTCHVDEALPGVVHCIAKYPDAPQEAMVQCVMAGGDSSARVMLVAMVLLAWPENGGLAALPQAWITGLRKGADIERHLQALG